MRLIALFFLIWSSSAAAQLNGPLGPGIPTVETLIKEFRDPLRTKIEEIHQNYISVPGPHGVNFTSNMRVHCANQLPAEPKAFTGKIEYATHLTNNTLSEAVRYYTCNGVLLFTETIYTTGSKVQIPKIQDVINGQRTFTLTADETERSYSFTDSEQHELIRIDQKRIATRYNATFLIDGKEGLTYNEESNGSQVQAVYRASFNDFSYRRKNSRTRSSYGGARPVTLSVQVFPNGQREFVSSMNEGPIPFSTFTKTLAEVSQDGPIGAVGYALGMLMNELPPTVFVSAGITSGRMIDELNLIIRRINEKGNLDQVKNLIQEYLQAVKDGKIKDDRPKK
jgi:hypothetical protein